MTNDEFEQTGLARQYLLPDQKLAKIIEWLYIHDGKYPNKNQWREALIKMLKEVL